jgi:hypothetical protein
MRKSLLSILSAVILVMAISIPFGVTVFAAISPFGATTNSVNVDITRLPTSIAKIGDTMHYEVAVTVPDHVPGTGNKPGFQADLNTYFTSPADLVPPAIHPQAKHTIDFPLIPELLPGESVLFKYNGTESTIYDPQPGQPTRAQLILDNTTYAIPYPATYRTSTTEYPGEPGQYLIVGGTYSLLTYVINATDMVNNPGLDALSYTYNIQGSHTSPGSNDNAQKAASVGIDVADTTVKITSPSASVNNGESVTLTVTEKNTGNINLTAPVHVVVNKNHVFFADLLASSASGDGGVAGTLEAGETWTWSLNSQALNADTAFEAIGHGMAQTTDVTYSAGPPVIFPNERFPLNITVNQPSTLAGIWATPDTLPQAGTVTLTVTENNNGPVALNDVVMTVTNNRNATTYTLRKTGSTSPAVFTGGDTGDDGELGLSETWTWSIPGVPVDSDIIFTVDGDATYGSPLVHVNYNAGVTGERNHAGVNLSPPNVPASSNMVVGFTVAGFVGIMLYFGYRRIRKSHS